MVDKNFALEGYYAIGGRTCKGCAFENKNETECRHNNSLMSCYWENRPDRMNVIFKKKDNGMNELTNEKTMTIKEVSKALGVSEKTVTRHARKMGFTSNGIKTLLNGKQCTAIKNAVAFSGRNDLDNVVLAKNTTTETEENEIVMRAVAILKRNRDEYKRRAEIAETKCIELQPKADYADKALKTKNQLTIRDAGKLLQIRQSDMFGFIRFKRLLTTKSVPTQKALDMNILTLKQYVINTDDGPITKDSACMTMQNIDNFKQIYLDTGKFSDYLFERKNGAITTKVYLPKNIK